MAPRRIAVVGAGAWGTVLALVAAQQGGRVSLLMRDDAAATAFNRDRTSPRLPATVRVPASLTATAEPSAALDGADVVVLAVPAQAMRAAVAAFLPFAEHQIIVSAAKGLELSTHQRMSEVITAAAMANPRQVLALSGPNLAREIAEGKPAASVVAGEPTAAQVVIDAFGSDRFRLYAQPDLIGVELAGSLKNVIALAAGVADGIGAGDNAKAALVTRGLAEMARIGEALGAHARTFAGLAGLGDLYATCASPLSRNRRAGEMLAHGATREDIAVTLGEVAEGMTTAFAARELAASVGVSAPITNEACRLLAGESSPAEAMRALMQRETGME